MHWVRLNRFLWLVSMMTRRAPIRSARGISNSSHRYNARRNWESSARQRLTLAAAAAEITQPLSWITPSPTINTHSFMFCARWNNDALRKQCSDGGANWDSRIMNVMQLIFHNSATRAVELRIWLHRYTWSFTTRTVTTSASKICQSIWGLYYYKVRPRLFSLDSVCDWQPEIFTASTSTSSNARPLHWLRGLTHSLTHSLTHRHTHSFISFRGSSYSSR